MIGAHSSILMNVGDLNTSIGFDSGNSGLRNVSIGCFSGNAMHSDAIDNIVIGSFSAAKLTTGDQNIFIGTSAGPSVTFGSQNILIGNQAGLNITGGSRNILIGEKAGGESSLGSDNVGVGRDISIPGSNNILIGGNISTATSTKHICVIGTDNTGVNGRNITLIGRNISTFYNTSSNICAIGQNTSIISTTFNDTVSLFNNNFYATMRGNGDFVVSGSAYKPAGGSWASSSDRRLKSNIHLANTIMCENILKKLDLKRFTWNADFNLLVKDRTQLGFIAQEVEEYLPKAVITTQFEKLDDCKLLDTSQINMVMYGALKRSIARIDELEAILARNNFI
jgi:hypothetical protein